MIKTLKIKSLNLTFVCKWNKKEPFRTKKYKLGFWFCINKMVGKKDFNKPSEWSKNTVNDYRLGLDLIFINCWVDCNIGGIILTNIK